MILIAYLRKYAAYLGCCYSVWDVLSRKAINGMVCFVVDIFVLYSDRLFITSMAVHGRVASFEITPSLSST